MSDDALDRYRRSLEADPPPGRHHRIAARVNATVRDTTAALAAKDARIRELEEALRDVIAERHQPHYEQVLRNARAVLEKG